MARREQAMVLGDLLKVIAEQEAPRSQLPLTSVARKANLAYDRCVAYVKRLQGAGLLEPTGPLRLTDAGHRFLRSYAAWKRALDNLPVSETEPAVTQEAGESRGGSSMLDVDV